jgi:hypothetical protein
MGISKAADGQRGRRETGDELTPSPFGHSPLAGIAVKLRGVNILIMRQIVK